MMSASMADVLENHRRRNHRAVYLINIEDEIAKAKRDKKEGTDISHWRYSENKYKNRFFTKQTWNIIRTKHAINEWYKGVWFKHATPKYSFMVWLAIQNRLATGDRMRSWNMGLQIVCSLCGAAEDTRNHLFFECPFSGALWSKLMLPFLGTEYTTSWDKIIDLLTSPRPKYILFLFRYAFQSAVYHLWRERNCRRHGEKALTMRVLSMMIDKNVKNRINSIRSLGDHAYGEAMDLWLSNC